MHAGNTSKSSAYKVPCPHLANQHNSSDVNGNGHTAKDLNLQHYRKLGRLLQAATDGASSTQWTRSWAGPRAGRAKRTPRPQSIIKSWLTGPWIRAVVTADRATRPIKSLSLSLSLYIYIYIYIYHTHTHTHAHTHTHTYFISSSNSSTSSLLKENIQETNSRAVLPSKADT